MGITKKNLRLPPLHAPGHEVAATLQSSVQFARLGQIAFSVDTQPALLADLPKNLWVDEVIAVTSSDLPGDNYVVVGLADDCDLFFGSSDICREGSHSSKNETSIGHAGYACSSSDETLEASWSTGISTGTITFYMKFIPDYRGGAVLNAT